MRNVGNLFKYLDKLSHGFWNCKKILTYGRPVIIVTGSRSTGKSTNVAIFTLLDFLENGKKFIYSRRRDKDTRLTCKTFFNNAVDIINREGDFKILGFKYEHHAYYIATEYREMEDGDEEPELDWVKCGEAIPLANEEDYKSAVYSDYCTIIYDEFISKNRNRYLGTKDTPEAEWDALTSLYQTVDRGIDKPFRNETRLFLLANKDTAYNPVMLSLNVCDYITPGAKFTAPKGKVWVWENVKSVEATSEIQESFGYQMSSEHTQKYAYENESSYDTTFFIKKPKVSSHFATLKLKGIVYEVRVDSEYNFYILDKVKGNYSIIALDNDSHDNNDLRLIRRWQESPTMTIIESAYRDGRLYFGNGKIQAAFVRYLDFMR